MFDLYIGIDWSGARGQFHKGIQVAEARPGKSAPVIIDPPDIKGWSRQAVLDYIRQRAKNHRVLAGIDFAFAHPFMDEGFYFPGLADGLRTPQELWAMVEAVNHEQDHLYGGGIWEHPDYGAYYNAPRKEGRGVKFSSRRRMTETISAQMNGKHPSPTFNCVGPAGVGTGSLAGMRLLHRLKDEARIWPIIPRADANLTVVEIFPSLYFSMAGAKDRKKEINKALECWGSGGVTSITKGLSDHDDLDALISAAALRRICNQGMPPIDPEYQHSAKQEGWIIGAGWAKNA